MAKSIAYENESNHLEIRTLYIEREDVRSSIEHHRPLFTNFDERLFEDRIYLNNV